MGELLSTSDFATKIWGLINKPQILSTYLFELEQGEETKLNVDAGLILVRYNSSANIYIAAGPNYDMSTQPQDILTCEDIGKESSKKIRVYKPANYVPYYVKNNDTTSHKIQVIAIGYHGNQVSS